MQAKAPPLKCSLTISELALSARILNSDAFGNIHENRVNAIIQATLDELIRQIEPVEEGEIEVKGFGKFIIKQTQLQKPDIKTIQHRIIFRKERKTSKLPI